MISLVVAALFAQSPAQEPLPVAPSHPAGCLVALVRAEGMDAASGDAVVARVAQALERHGIPMPVPPAEVHTRAGKELRGCGAQPACFAGVARTLEAGALVTVDAALLFGELTVELALLDASSGRLLADKVFAGALESASVGAQLEDFARTARYALMTLPAFKAPPPADAPRAANLTPSRPPASPAALTATSPDRTLAWVATGAAVTAAAAAATFGGLSLSTWSRANAGQPGNRVDVTRPEAEAMTRNSWVAGIAGGACAALTSAAVYLWLNPPEAAR